MQKRFAAGSTLKGDVEWGARQTVSGTAGNGTMGRECRDPGLKVRESSAGMSGRMDEDARFGVVCGRSRFAGRRDVGVRR